MALPTMYNETTGSYDKKPIIECCEYLETFGYSGLIVIKSTVEPETTHNLSTKFKKLSFVHNPEFLTARTAYEDFHNQTHIVIGQGNNCSNSKLELIRTFYSTYYPNAEISVCTSLESESMKIFCNSFYAVKVQFFTELFLLTKSNGSDYDKIVSMMLKNNWINSMHTQVPGPDGQASYGGLCFPKDTNALNKYMERTNSANGVLEACIKERNKMRNDNDNIIKKTVKPIIKISDVSNSNSNSHSHSNPNSNPNSNSNSKSHSNPNSQSHSNSKSHSNSNSQFQS